MNHSQAEHSIAEAIEEFAKDWPADAPSATEEQVQSTLEMIAASSKLYGITPLQWVFHAVQALAVATDCHSRFALLHKQDPHVVLLALKMKSDRTPEVIQAKAYLEDEGEYK